MNKLPQKINLKDKLSKFKDFWAPRVIAEMNDYQFKLVKIKDEFVWHSHQETDEVFIVIDGSMRVYFRSGHIDIHAGEMIVVPVGIEHKPFAHNECHIMLVEPRGVVNTADAGGPLTAENDVWV